MPIIARYSSHDTWSPEVVLGEVTLGESATVHFQGREVTLPPANFSGTLYKALKPNGGGYQIELRQSGGILWNETAVAVRKNGHYYWQ